MVKECRGYQLAAKAPPIKIQPWPKTDVPYTMIHIDYAGPLNGHYYLIIVASFSKRPEIFMCRHPTSTDTVNVLNELFERFRPPKTLVSDNRAQFTGKEFKDFCTSLSLSIDHITTSVYHRKSSGQAERFMYTFKRALKIKEWTLMRRVYKRFKTVYRITPNLNTDSDLLPAELMFARKIWSVFDRLLSSSTKTVVKKTATKSYKSWDGFLQKLQRWEKVLRRRNYHLVKWYICLNGEDSNVRDI